jgi:phosphomannomutase
MSGTEPLMRVYAEAASPERVEELLNAMGLMVGIGEQQPGVGAR